MAPDERMEWKVDTVRVRHQGEAAIHDCVADLGSLGKGTGGAPLEQQGTTNKAKVATVNSASPSG